MKGKGKKKEEGDAAAILVDGGAGRDEVGGVSRSSSSRTRLGIPAEPPPIARAGDPSFDAA